jgi:hypothetical protein
VPVVDAQPRVRPARLPDVPVRARTRRGVHVPGTLAALAALGLGLAVLVCPRRPRASKETLA